MLNWELLFTFWGNLMSDRYNALIVTLEQPIKDEDAADLMTAIRQLRGVATVDGNVADLESYIAFARARSELSQKLLEVVCPSR